jgi:hypothetical protein
MDHLLTDPRWLGLKLDVVKADRLGACHRPDSALSTLGDLPGQPEDLTYQRLRISCRSPAPVQACWAVLGVPTAHRPGLIMISKP